MRWNYSGEWEELIAIVRHSIEITRNQDCQPNNVTMAKPAIEVIIPKYEDDVVHQKGPKDTTNRRNCHLRSG